jgi:hypothetical protein
VTPKVPKPPVWWKNSFFWFAGILAGLALFGLVRGEDVIRDPGQRWETGLVWIYLGGAVVMLVNGLMSHQQACQAFSEASEED